MSELALGLAVVTVVCLVVVARWPRGGWARRFGWAAPCGAAAGFAEALVLVEAGFGFAWWLPVLGVAVAAALPLTRRARTGARTPAAIGDYRLEGEFARTATAVIYRAGGAAPGSVLVKQLAPELAGDPDARLRLWGEGQVLAGLDHPHCVRLREALGDQQAPVLVLAGIDGAPLASLTHRAGQLTPPQALAVAADVLTGLAALHDNGLVHRDVAPENVWLDASGRALLANFEHACVGVEHPVAPRSGRYASPEQRSGAVLDGRTDVWACAAMVRDLLGDRVPEAASGPLAQALADDASQRPAAGELAGALADAAQHEWGRTWRDRAALGAALAAHGLIGSAVAGWVAGGAAGTGGTTGSAALGAAPDAGSAGLGAPAPAEGTAALGAAPSGGSTAASSGAPTAASPAGTGAAGTGTSGVAGASSAAVPAGTTATATAAVVAAAVVIAGGVAPAPADPGSAPAGGGAAATVPPATDPPPTGPVQAAGDPVVDPAEAERIFRDVLGDTGADETDPLGRLRDEVGEIGEPTDLVVGVSCDAAAPWFVVSAEVSADEGTVQVWARLVPDGDADPEEDWSLTNLNWAREGAIGAPAVDPRGCAAPDTDPTELIVDPAEIPRLYEELLVWELDVTRSSGGGPLPAARQLVTHNHGEDMRRRSVLRLVGSLTRVVRDHGEMASMSYTYDVGEVDAVVPLASGVVLVTFPATVHVTWFNRPGQTTGPCTEHVGGDRWITSYMSPVISAGSWGQTSSGISETGREPWVRDDGGRQVDFQYEVRATAWVPTHGHTGADVPYTVGDATFPARVVILDEHRPTVTVVPC